MLCEHLSAFGIRQLPLSIKSRGSSRLPGSSQVKTRQAHLEAIAKVLKDKEYHPYDCAELIALPIVAGAKDYMQWAIDQTAPAS